jgi:putative hydrolase of the HAD superfamily
MTFLSETNGYSDAVLSPAAPKHCVKIITMGQTPWDVVIFDYGRVLSQSPTAAELQEFAELVGVEEPPFFQIYSDTRDEYDRGRFDCHQHWQHFAGTAGISLKPDHVTRIVEFENRMWVRANPATLDLVRDIRSQGMRTAILSNMPSDLLERLRGAFDWLDEFDVQIWSCDHGVIKPDAAIYRLCLDALGCKPHRALFFDDRPRNVEGARAVGMDAHLFESAEQAAEIVNAGVS